MKQLWLTILTLTTLGTAAWGDSPWLTDLAAAQKAAAVSGKLILVDVTGSDWCLPCQQTENEVFSQPGFLPAAQEKYILLRIDFPRHTDQSERLRVQNRAFAERYPFEGFPTLFVLDAGGRLLGQNAGFVPGGSAAYLDRAAALAAQKGPLETLVGNLAQAGPGVPRLQAMDALFRQAEAWGIEAQYGDLPLKIVLEDKDGKAGLKPRYQVYNAYQRLLGTWASKGDDRQAAADFDALAARAQAWPDLAQKILFTAGMVRLNALEDETAARDTFRKARALGPGTPVGQRAAVFLDRLP